MPAAYTSAQKLAISEYTSVTQSDKSAAAKVLKQHNWDVSSAVNAFFNSAPIGPNPLRASLGKIFDKYRDDPQNSPDEISIEGTAQLLGEIEIDLSDIAALVFSELVSSPSLGNITRDGFVDGWTEAGVDTLPKMRDAIAHRRAQLSRDQELFRSVYHHTFVLALQERQKSLPMEMAIEFWKVLFSEPGFVWQTANTPWLAWWFEFYQSKIKKAVNKDLWKQTLNFAIATIKDDSLSFWSEESSWPSVIDEFVEWVRTEKRPSAGNEAMDVE